jgi:predicted acyltransferase
LIYTVTALLSTNFVAECIISTHWRGVVHLQGCNQLLPNFVSQKLSRKLVHITSGLLFALCWPFFRCCPHPVSPTTMSFSAKDNHVLLYSSLLVEFL